MPVKLWRALSLVIAGAALFFTWDMWRLRRAQAAAEEAEEEQRYHLQLPEDLRTYYEEIGPLPEGFDQLAPPTLSLEDSNVFDELQQYVDEGWIPPPLTYG